ncbi:hypothetical protein JCM16776_0610 [Leptotrichia shahii]|uniref:Uncharacterized protein n=1 Tax=Leptotrichia shahii TaxID=157691 RepID=A0A510JM24_9FUSO|nr:hypothetical protein [Leptotrichia shahii]BBM40390.1 hypothetical protein JCM16776_0610 [Leptotrichia shahii]
MIKLNFKIMILIVGIVFMLVSINKKYGKYKEILNNRKILIENKRNLENKIVNVVESKNAERSKIMREYNEIIAIAEKLSFLSIKNESEFKKMIYVFSHDSGLKMKEISKSENIWERNGYRLKYIHFTVYGSLNNFGKFIYFVNKSKKYIDTSKIFMELTSDGFKISLGFIEKVENKSKISI